MRIASTSDMASRETDSGSEEAMSVEGACPFTDSSIQDASHDLCPVDSKSGGDPALRRALVDALLRVAFRWHD